MAVSTFLGLQTALRGILAQQRALDVTAHNVANASTVGFTRQEALLAPSAPYAYAAASQPGQLGTGVDVTEYRRIRDAFLDVQLRAQTMRLGSAEATSDGLRQVELALNEPSDTGAASLLSRYWAAWQDVSNSPENLATRQTLVQSAASLAEGFRTLDGQLATLVTQAQDNVAMTLAEANSLGARVASLGASISDALVNGSQPNDLLDERDQLLDRLYELGNVTVTSGAYGALTVTLGGATLVSGTVASTLSEASFPPGGLTSGKLAALRTLRDTTLPGYRADLNTVASTLISQTNTLHAAGFDLQGLPGGAFFTGAGADTIAVSGALLGSPGLVAASATGQPGDGARALSLAGLHTTVDPAYSLLVTRIGADAQEAARTLGNAEVLVDALSSRRESVSGVSLDEEMTNLLRFQRGYQASARALSAMDEMIELLISRTGRVGL